MNGSSLKVKCIPEVLTKPEEVVIGELDTVVDAVVTVVVADEVLAGIHCEK